MITGVDHFAIIVSSEEVVSFYKKLGFKEVFRKKRSHDTVVLLDGFGLQMEIFVDPRHPMRATKPENLGLRHLALKVERIEKTAEELKIKIGTIQCDWMGVRFAYTKDPDGNPVELHE